MNRVTVDKGKTCRCPGGNESDGIGGFPVPFPYGTLAFPQSPCYITGTHYEQGAIIHAECPDKLS